MSVLKFYVSRFSPDSVGREAPTQPLIPADIAYTYRYPMCFARRAAFGAFLHMKFEH
jgi:hypothetical protein